MEVFAGSDETNVFEIVFRGGIFELPVKLGTQKRLLKPLYYSVG